MNTTKIELNTDYEFISKKNNAVFIGKIVSQQDNIVDILFEGDPFPLNTTIDILLSLFEIKKIN